MTLAAALPILVSFGVGGSTASCSLLKGTELENQVCVLRGRKEGPAVYIVAGIHGDETAGFMAAERLKHSRISAGTLYILSPANRYGAAENKRLTEAGRDLNRNFPGDPEGCDAERIADAIYRDIQDKKPDLVLDLHEAKHAKESRDALGNSLICQSIEQTGDLVLWLLTESEEGRTAFPPLTLYGSPPPGSINRVVTEELGIPVITVETLRDETPERRIGNHLEIADAVLRYCGLR